MSTRSYLSATGHCLGWCRVAAACVAAMFVSAAVAGSGSAAVGVKVVENTADRIVVQYQFGDFSHRSVDLDGQRYLQIVLPHEAQMLVAGAPDLPHVARSLIIPEDGAMAAAVADARFYELENVNVVSSKGSLPRTIDPATLPFVFGSQYTTDAFFPGALVTAGKPYILRDFRGMVVDVYPFQYNPVTHTLRVYTALTVAVTRVGPGGANVLPASRFRRDLSRAFHDVYVARFINYVPEVRYTPLDENGDLLIICYDQWISNMQPLVAHKNAIGINTTIVGVSTVGNNATAIKSYIQSRYNTSNLAFVLLVGDAAQVASPSASGGSADPTYGLLAGSDNYPDAMIGRFSADTAAQVDTQVLRTVEYETLLMTQQPWFKKATGIASEYGAGQGDNGEADWEHMDVIRNLLLSRGYTQVDQIYGTNGGTAAMVTSALNAGRGLVNYCGHGSVTSWGTTGFSNSHVDALVNDNKLPIIFSVACVNGQFDGYTCFAEAWMWATHGGEPTGAVATYMSSINQSWAEPMAAQDEFVRLLTDPNQPYRSVGTLYYAGSCAMMDKYPSGGPSMYNTWHTFGDPTLCVVGVTTPPHGLKVTPADGLSAQGPEGGPFTPNSISYTLLNQDTTPIDYQVTRTQAWVLVNPASGTLPPSGTASVTVSIGPGADLLGTGLYSDTVTFTNLTNHDGDTTRSVALKVGVPTPQFTWSLDTNPGWTTQGQWAFGHPTGGGGGSYGYPDPSNGATGTNVYGVNLNGNYSTTPGGPYYLTLGPVDLTGIGDVSLKFQRWLNSDYQPYVYATIDVSNSGTAWTPVFSNGTAEIKENAWSLKSYDLPSAANQPTVYIRWGYQVASGAYAYSGWNIDDVAIWGLHAAPPPARGDLNCDGIVDFADINPFVMALAGQAEYESTYPTCRWLNGDINGDSMVDFADINPFVECLSSGVCP